MHGAWTGPVLAFLVVTSGVLQYDSRSMRTNGHKGLHVKAFKGFLIYALVVFLSFFAFITYSSVPLAALTASIGALILSRKTSLFRFHKSQVAYAFIPIALVVLLKSHEPGVLTLQLMVASFYYLIYSLYFMVMFFVLSKLSIQNSSTRFLLVASIATLLIPASKTVWDSERAGHLLAQKRKLMSLNSSQVLEDGELSGIFNHDGAILRHSLGGEVRAQMKDGKTYVTFFDVPAGDICWTLAFMNNDPDFEVEVDSRILRGAGSPKTAQEFSSFRSEVCGNSWNLSKTVQVKIIFPNDR
jgi:hypothetical protein